MGGDHNADVRHLLQLVDCRLLERLQRTKIGCQTRRGRFPYFADTQRIKEAGKSGVFGFFQCVGHVLRGFRPHTIQPGQLTRRQAEQISGRMDILFLDQLIDDFVAHAIDVHRPAGDEVFQRLFTLGAAN